MTDVFDAKTRSWVMSRARGRDTLPERIVRSLAHSMGYRFRLCVTGLPGRPDLVFARRRAVVFVHGCFWHQHQNCKHSHIPQTRSEFWQKKFTRNVLRDQKVIYQLKMLGWRTAIIWECGLNKIQYEDTVKRLVLWLRWRGEYLEIPVYDEFNEQ